MNFGTLKGSRPPRDELRPAEPVLARRDQRPGEAAGGLGVSTTWTGLPSWTLLPRSSATRVAGVDAADQADDLAVVAGDDDRLVVNVAGVVDDGDLRLVAAGDQRLGRHLEQRRDARRPASPGRSCRGRSGGRRCWMSTSVSMVRVRGDSCAAGARDLGLARPAGALGDSDDSGVARRGRTARSTDRRRRRRAAGPPWRRRRWGPPRSGRWRRSG